MPRSWQRSLPLLLAAVLSACDPDDGAEPTPEKLVTPNPAPPGEAWGTLSEWQLFADIERQRPANRVLSFEVNSVLSADNAAKSRFLYLPEGALIGFSDSERWDLPLGTILVKTFWYPKDERDPSLGRQLVETRLLVHEPEGWNSYLYLYQDSQTEAVRHDAGRTVDLSYVDASGSEQQRQYNVPNLFDCQSCHGVTPDTHPLGPSTRQLDRDHDYGKGLVNQIDHFAKIGWLDVDPPAQRERLSDPYGSGPIVERARAYLDANCAHCHSLGGKAESTGFSGGLRTNRSDDRRSERLGTMQVPDLGGDGERRP